MTETVQQRNATCAYPGDQEHDHAMCEDVLAEEAAEQTTTERPAYRVTMPDGFVPWADRELTIPAPHTADEIARVVHAELESVGYVAADIDVDVRLETGTVQVTYQGWVSGSGTITGPGVGEPAETNTACVRCTTTPAAPGVCCPPHDKPLCHLCYRRTHFVEVCVAGCRDCAAEHLPVWLSELATPAPPIVEVTPETLDLADDLVALAIHALAPYDVPDEATAELLLNHWTRWGETDAVQRREVFAYYRSGGEVR